MPNWNDRARQLQDRAQLQGDDLQNEARNDQSKYNDREAWGQGSADELYNQLNNNPGYLPSEAGQINADYGQFRTPKDQLNNRYLSDQEQSDVRGDPYGAMSAYNPDALSNIASQATGSQDAALAQQEGNLNAGVDRTRGALDSAANNPNLGLSADYTGNASTGLNQTQRGIADSLSGGEGNVRGALSRNLSDYKMTPQEQQDIVTGAGISAGTGYRASEDALQRSAAAAGANPMGVAAYRARAERDAAGEAGDAMTKARIQASDAAAGRKMNEAQIESGAESDLGKQRVAGVEASGNMQQDVLNRGEQMRLGANQDIASRQMQAGTTAGQMGQQADEYAGNSRLNTQNQNATRALGTEAANQSTGQNLLAAGENATSNRAGALAQNRQGITGDTQNTAYQQGMGTTQATAQGAQQVGGARMAGQQEARNYYTGQGQQAQQGALTASGQKLGAYGAQYGAQNAAEANGIKADSKPGLWQNIAGTVIGGAKAAGSLGLGFAEGGVVTQPTLATVGESGPEWIGPPQGAPQQSQPQPYRAAKTAPAMGAPQQSPYGRPQAQQPWAHHQSINYQQQQQQMQMPQQMQPQAAGQNYRAQPSAAGRIVTKPTTALIGESGPEAVVPLNGRLDANVRPSVAFGKQAMRYGRKHQMPISA